MESDLEAGVQDIEKTVGETPHEEPGNIVRMCFEGMMKRNIQGGNERNGNNGLASSKLRSTSHNTVVHALSSSLLLNNLDGRWATTLLLMDFIDSRFLRTVHAEDLHHGGESKSKRMI